MSYLFQRGSTWYVKTQGAKRIERSLHTSDKAQANVLAAPFIAAHMREIAARRPRVEATKRYEPGLHDGENGERIAATALEVSFYDTAGKLLRVEPNTAIQIVGNGRLSALDEFTAFDDAYKGTIGTGAVVQRQIVTKSADDAILDDYLNHRNVTGYPRREAEMTWALFRQLTGGKPLSKCNRQDGRDLVAHYQAQKPPLKVASIHKRLVRLNAAVKFAIDEGKLHRDTINPFAAVVAKVGEDSIRKVALDDADLKACREATDAEGVNLFGKLSAHDQLLFRVLCTSGMRLNEAFQIKSEMQTDKGTRYCVVTARKGQVGKLLSQRSIPFAAHLLPHLPAVINGPLFKGTTNDASHRLNAFLRECGITDKAKTMNSLRHRAIAIVKATRCDQSIRYALFGHIDGVKVNEIAEGYGAGGFIEALKEIVDQIDGI